MAGMLEIKREFNVVENVNKKWDIVHIDKVDVIATCTKKSQAERISDLLNGYGLEDTGWGTK